MYHYTYLITNIQEEKHYIGSRTCKSHPCEDLGKKYFSSSTDKEFVQNQKDYPQNYQYQVLEAHFPTRTAATEEEISLHLYFDVARNERFYNKAKQTSVKFDTTGITLSAKTRKKMTDARTGKVFSIQHKENISKSLCGRSFSFETRNKLSMISIGRSYTNETNKKKGRPKTDEMKKHLSEKLKGYKHSEEFKERCRGRIHTEETKLKMADTYIYHFQHTTYGERICNKFQLLDEFPGLKSNGLTAYLSGRHHQYKGWTVTDERLGRKPRKVSALTIRS